jgi:two-component system chemotaxis sensor kinase CheA
MDELLEQFLIEGRDLVAQASADLAALSRDPGASAEIDSAFRAIHTLKGSVGIFAMGPAERVLHAAEEVLERARKDAAALDRGTVDALTACLDAVDRWIDELERTGLVAGEAEADGDAAIARLPRAGVADAEERVGASHAWVEGLAAREAQVIASATTPLVAFRYVPDADCFFRGDDPLAVALAVPGLAALTILPLESEWPALDAIEPFECISALEGVSSAVLDEVRAAFRLLSTQVELHVIEPRATRATEAVPAEAHRLLRVDAGRVDALNDDLGEVLVAANALTAIAQDVARLDRRLGARIRAAQAEIEGKVGKLHRSVARVRLVSLAPALRRLPRLAREIAESLGKDIAFSMSGEALEVDKEIADALFEPLLHLVRNAIDHGIEDGAARVGAGKPAQGAVTLAVRREGDAIVISLSDDGAGIDPARLREAAVARGLLAADSAEALSDVAALRLIFTPGFSTAREVTGISGRGVGMDAVRAALDKLRGTIEIDSAAGRGTRFGVRLPANALTTRLLVIEVGENRYGVPLDQIIETVRVDNDALVPVGGGLACVLRGRTVPVLSLATLLGEVPAPAAHAKLLVTRSAGDRVALRVDGFAERLDTVVRPPAGMLGGLRGVSGSALLGDGGVLLVLDLPGLAA